MARASWRRFSLGGTRADPKAAYEEAIGTREERAIAWLGRDPAPEPIFRLVLLTSWQHEPGQRREGVPRRVRVLAAGAVLAHFQQDPYGRRELDP